MSEFSHSVAVNFSRVVPGRLDAIEGLSQDLALWLERSGATSRVVFSITLMLDELVTNIVVHGYNSENSGTIQIDAEILGESVAVTLRDHAPAFNPLLAAEPDVSLGIEQRSVGGLGIHFVRKMADSISYQRLAEGVEMAANELRFVKRLAEMP